MSGGPPRSISSCSSDQDRRCVKRPHIQRQYTRRQRPVILFLLCSCARLRAMERKHDRPVSRYELVFTVEMALREASRLWPKKRTPGDHDRLRPVAEAVVKHLERCGMRCVGRDPGHDTFDPFARREGSGPKRVEE